MKLLKDSYTINSQRYPYVQLPFITLTIGSTN